MDDDRIESDALAAVDFLRVTEADLSHAAACDDPASLMAIRSARYQAMWFLANYFSRQNAPLIAAATASEIAKQ